MAFLVLGLAANEPVRIDDAAPIATSFPGFVALMNGLGARDRVSVRRPFVVAIDGPAASGKGTLARRLAEHFGFAHLDTGRLYRAAAFLALDAGGDPADPAAAEAAARRVDAALLADRRLRGEAVGEAASVVAAIPAVRARAARLPARFRRAARRRRRRRRGARRPRHRHGGLPGRRPSSSSSPPAREARAARRVEELRRQRRARLYTSASCRI